MCSVDGFFAGGGNGMRICCIFKFGVLFDSFLLSLLKTWNFGQSFRSSCTSFWQDQPSWLLLLLLIWLASCNSLESVLIFIKDSTIFLAPRNVISLSYFNYDPHLFLSIVHVLDNMWYVSLESLNIWFRWDNLPSLGLSIFRHTFHMQLSLRCPHFWHLKGSEIYYSTFSSM